MVAEEKMSSIPEKSSEDTQTRSAHNQEAREGSPRSPRPLLQVCGKLHYIRWQYDVETERREAITPVLYYVECDTQRPTLAFV